MKTKFLPNFSVVGQLDGVKPTPIATVIYSSVCSARPERLVIICRSSRVSCGVKELEKPYKSLLEF